ncbi:unnamed protein product [Soboliphyme baturini]|uniref:Eukaryotic translation initiation factor 3 subunit B n=1 Tax=Soboliphyme baturini TaxID=241478 RepID=A0A183IH47_9BILA|nr:unnamed protein product [Soboliphyme baturini]
MVAGEKFAENFYASRGNITQNSVDAEPPSFSDPDGYVDDISDEELLGDILKLKPREDDSNDLIVVVDGIPIVGSDRLPKLKSVMSKILSKIGHVVREFYPMENDQTKGYRHVEEKWEVPKPRPYKDHGNLRSWLLNPDCFDQFVIQCGGGGDEWIAVHTNTPSEPTIVVEKKDWSESAVQWSPFGTYLATVHKKGIALWGGEKFEQIIRFSHLDVRFFDFSPCERYIVTYAEPKNRYADASDALKIWDVRTGEMKRAFAFASHICKRWPCFKWSHDGSFFAALKDDVLSVYETSSFALLGKKSLRIDGIRDFQWSPSAPFLAYWVAEKNQAPGRVALMKIPEKIDVRSKNMFNMAEASIYWQKSGDNLCFKVDRYGKKKEEKDGEIKYSGITYNLEIFHFREKEVPVSTQEVKEPVQAFDWEPLGSKFAVIQGDLKTNVNFYTLRTSPLGISHLKTLSFKQQVNTIFWSPVGQYLVFAGLKSTVGGTLAFVDASGTDINLTNSQEHTGVTDVVWDPTGRYVVTSVSSWTGGRGGDTGYMMWNFLGRLLQRKPIERFCKFAWRPRPAPLLPELKIKEIRKNMKKYSSIFEEKDRQILSKASEEILNRRRKLVEEFNKWREPLVDQWNAEKPLRVELRGVDTDSIFVVSDMQEEVVEYLINEEETVIAE